MAKKIAKELQRLIDSINKFIKSGKVVIGNGKEGMGQDNKAKAGRKRG